MLPEGCKRVNTRYRGGKVGNRTDGCSSHRGMALRSRGGPRLGLRLLRSTESRVAEVCCSQQEPSANPSHRGRRRVPATRAAPARAVPQRKQNPLGSRAPAQPRDTRRESPWGVGRSTPRHCRSRSAGTSSRGSALLTGVAPHSRRAVSFRGDRLTTPRQRRRMRARRPPVPRTARPRWPMRYCAGRRS
jgi:hypothetical protein